VTRKASPLTKFLVMMVGCAAAVVFPSAASAQQFKATSGWTAGYIASSPNAGNNFNKVTATWVQPALNCGISGQSTVFFQVELAGQKDVGGIHGGVRGSCDFTGPNGQLAASYEAWDLGSYSQNPTFFPVSAGDKVTATVALIAPYFQITVKDDTTGQSFTDYPVGDGSDAATLAEVMAGNVNEDDDDTGADYGKVTFTGISMHNNHGKTGTFVNKNWNDTTVTRIYGTTTIASPSKLTSSGASFTDTWKALGAH